MLERFTLAVSEKITVLQNVPKCKSNATGNNQKLTSKYKTDIMHCTTYVIVDKSHNKYTFCIAKLVYVILTTVQSITD